MVNINTKRMNATNKYRKSLKQTNKSSYPILKKLINLSYIKKLMNLNKTSIEI